jgi:NarL family two-component system response regulator LiaR
MIRVLICDDQLVVRAGLHAILGTVPGIEVVGEAVDGDEVLSQVEALAPDVVLMDLKMPGTNGVQATRAIRDRHPHVGVLVLTTYDADEWVLNAVRAGASGYLLKDTPREALVAAIEGTAAGETHVDPAVAGKLFRQVALGPAPSASAQAIAAELSPREMEVLRLLARGLNNADIAGQLHLSEGTVRNYVSTILDKLDVADRTQAAVLALRCGLVAADSP